MLEAKFYDTYYFCNVIKSILYHSENHLGVLNEFYGDGRIYYRLSTFNKYSVFHEFVEFIVHDIYYDQSSEAALANKQKMYEDYQDIPIAFKLLRPATLPIELALEHHNMPHQNFEDFLDKQNKEFTECNIDDVYEFIHELRETGVFHELIEHISKEVFHILFQNRDLMKTFNILMANALDIETTSETPSEIKHLFTRPGILKRAAIPEWVRRAVFFRDRGRCVLCDKDLSGQVNLENKENYDHIVPLAGHGLNDISNIQLLCKECNQLEKGAGEAVTSEKYQSWYTY
ncbi:HNH endonuclease [Pseudomonas sp. TWP3-2]|uniref:HNH endonuclease n=1 Tax=Pseudomonas sp. TWP3-2 TaxID=2804574 RepID=UPI003CF3DB64